MKQRIHLLALGIAVAVNAAAMMAVNASMVEARPNTTSSVTQPDPWRGEAVVVAVASGQQLVRRVDGRRRGR